MGQVGQFLLGMADGTDIAEHGHVMGQFTAVVTDGADRLPLWIDFAALAPVPDLAAPFALLGQRGEDLLIERCAVAAGLELARALAEHFVLLIAGDTHERAVDVHDQALTVGHQYAFKRAVKYCRGHAQALAILTAQARTDADEVEQAGAGNEDQQRTDQYPHHYIDLPPHGQCQRVFRHTAQYHLRQHQPEDREHHIQRGHAQGVANRNRHVGGKSP